MKTIKNLSQYKLPLKITPQTGGGFIASCPVWPDCYAQGDTIEEVTLEITAVAQSLIELYKEEGLNIPLKTGTEHSLSNLGLTLPILVAA